MNLKTAQEIALDPTDVRGPVPMRKVIPHDGNQLRLRTFLHPNGHPIRTTIPVKEAPENFNGLGDRLAAITKSIGIQPCDGCEKRRQTLNRIFPKGGRKK